jgi:lysophospholipase L1-like esterase
LPLGDSITFGIGSTGLNGYREDLQKKLTAAGAKVEYVGPTKSGNTRHAGYLGYTINQISTKTDQALALKPNVVCLMSGTNDHLWGSTAGADPKTASTRVAALIDKIVKGAPDAVVLVATLPPFSLDHGKYTKYKQFAFPPDAFNKQLPSVAKAARDQGGKVAAVNMSLTTKDLSDGVHPNDAGYAKMATAWFNAIEDASAKSWVKNPSK